jgi:hypothetical protein
MGVSRPHTLFTYSPTSTLGRRPSGTGDYQIGPVNRDGTSLRPGLASILPRQKRRSLSYGSSKLTLLCILRSCDDFISPVLDYMATRARLSTPLRFSFNHDAPVSYDLRFPLTHSFRDLPRQIVTSDLTRFACEPPSPFMRLMQPRLSLP